MVDPNSSSKSAQCGQWKSSYKVIVTGASAEPSGMGRPFVMVTGVAETEAEGAEDGARPVRPSLKCDAASHHDNHKHSDHHDQDSPLALSSCGLFGREPGANWI